MYVEEKQQQFSVAHTEQESIEPREVNLFKYIGALFSTFTSIHALTPLFLFENSPATL